MEFEVVAADLQWLIVAFIAFQWWAIAQHVSQHRFFQYWTWGWACLAVLIFLSRTTTALAETAPLIALQWLRVGIVVAGILQLYFFAVGAWLLDARRSMSPRQFRFGAFIAVGVAVLLGLASIDFPLPHGLAIRVALRNVGLAVVFIYSAARLYVRRPDVQTVPYAVTCLAIFLLGCHTLLYASADISTLIDLATGKRILPFDSTIVLDASNWIIDMILNALIGVGTVLLMLAELRRARTRALEREAELRGIFDHAPIGIVILDETGTILHANPAFGDLLEVPARGLAGQRLDAFVEGAAVDFGEDSWRSPEASRRHSLSLRSGSGRAISGFLDVSPLPRTAIGARYVAQVLDMTSQHNLQERLSHLAMHDSVTGLPNRAYFREHLHATVKRMQRRGIPMVLMFIDLDKFKLVNDTLGHQAGDRLLQVVATRLVDALREGDFVSRYGGDEFTVVLEESADSKSVAVIAERIREAVAQPVELGETSVVPSVSVGVVISGLADEDEELLRVADEAMYRVKRSESRRPEIVDRSIEGVA